MLAVEVLVGLVVLLALAFVLSRDSASIDEEQVDAIDTGLPNDRLLRSDDIPRLRFRVGLRGYRMSDVDEVLEAVQRTLAAVENPSSDSDDEQLRHPQAAPDEAR